MAGTMKRQAAHQGAQNSSTTTLPRSALSFGSIEPCTVSSAWSAGAGASRYVIFITPLSSGAGMSSTDSKRCWSPRKITIAMRSPAACELTKRTTSSGELVISPATLRIRSFCWTPARSAGELGTTIFTNTPASFGERATCTPSQPRDETSSGCVGSPSASCRPPSGAGSEGSVLDGGLGGEGGGEQLGALSAR